MNKEIEIPEGHEARIEGNKVIIEKKETEDERIREQLIGHCKDLVRMNKDNKILLSIYEPWLAYLEKQKVITDSLKAAGIDVHQDGSIERHTMPYLEKQKEQNDVPSRETILGIWELGNFWKENPEERDGLTQLQYIQKYWFEKCDYLKEQKPIPKFKVGDCIYDKRDSYNRNVIREVGKDYYINAFAQKMDMAYTDANFEFLEHLNDDIIPNKPAEWSEEEEKDIQEASDYLRDYANNCVQGGNSKLYVQSLADRIESLRPQSHWKPSEQEKGALQTAIYILTEERRFPKAAAQLQNILNAFEGEESRKEWKPSDEQMDALKWLVEYVSPSEKYIIIIKKLYSDLKKL